MKKSEFEYAGFWWRFAAFLIDATLLAILMRLYPIIGGMFVAFPFLIGVPGSAATAGIAVFIYLFMWLLTPAIVTILFWKFCQATPGKMLISAQIVDADSGGKPTTGQCIGRWFAWILSALVLCLGLFWIGFDKRKQGWHDILAGTVVVRTKNPRVNFNTAKKARKTSTKKRTTKKRTAKKVARRA